MSQSFDITELDQSRLLSEWKWRCPQVLRIVDRSAFGDLFFEDESGRVHLLNVGSGSFDQIAVSVSEFRQLADLPEKREEWFSEKSARAASKRGLIPGPMECIGFSIPVVFAEGGGLDSAYVANIYDHVGFLGDLHRQLAALPDGAKVELVIKPAKPQP